MIPATTPLEASARSPAATSLGTSVDCEGLLEPLSSESSLICETELALDGFRDDPESWTQCSRNMGSGKNDLLNALQRIAQGIDNIPGTTSLGLISSDPFTFNAY